MSSSRWKGLLASADGEQRYAGVAEILDTNCREAASDLLSLLRDPCEVVSCAAIMALAELGEPLCLGPLTECALHDESADVRARAMWALGYRGDPESEAVLRAIGGSDRADRHAAMRALANLLEQPLEAPPRNERELAAEARDREECSTWLSSLRGSEDPNERVVAAEALSQIAQTGGRFPELAEPLLEALGDPLEEVRECAAAGLGALCLVCPAPAPDDLARALEIFPRLALLAGSWRMEQAVPTLMTWSGSKDPFLASAALQALAPLTDVRSSQVLSEAMTRTDLSNATAAEIAAGLGRLGVAAPLVRALRRCNLKQDGERVRSLARALGETLDQEAVPALVEAYRGTEPRGQKRMPKDFLARRDITEYHYETCAELVGALGRLTDVRALATLLTASASPNALVRSRAVKALAGLPLDKARSAIRQARQDPHPRVARAALQAVP